MNTPEKCLKIASLAALMLSGTAYAAAPTAVNDSRTIPVDSSITLNVISNDFDSDSDPIAVVAVGTSANASITLNSDGSVFYSPKAGFTGVDTFTYSLRENIEGGQTVTGTVTITIKNSDLAEIPTNQNTQNLAEALDIACNNLRESSDSELGAGRRNLLERCNALDALAANNPAAANAALRQIAPEETLALMRETADSSRTQTAAVSQRIGRLRAGTSAFTLNGVTELQAETGGAAGDGEPIWSALGFFASIQRDVAERDISALESGYKSRGNAATLGLDYRFNNKWVLGAALGFNQNDLDYSAHNGSVDSEITSFILFSSYTLEHSSIETQLGYAHTSFDSIRQVSYNEGNALVSDTMVGNTVGSQLLFNSQWQWDWNRNALTVSPFVRVDYLQNKVDGYGENGGGGLPMVIGKQATDQTTLGAGVQTTYVFNQNWGVLIPLLKLAILSEVNAASDPVVSRFSYDPDPDNTFTLENEGADKAFAQIGVGSSFVLKRGLSGFVQYQQLLGYSNLSAYQIQLGIRNEF